MGVIGILVIFNVCVIYLLWMAAWAMNMLRIFCLGKALRSISILGIIQTNRLVTRQNFCAQITRAVTRLEFLLHPISPMGLHTSKQTIFTIQLPPMIKCPLLTGIHIKFKSVQNSSPNTRSVL